MRIVICDDSIEYLSIIDKLLLKYRELNVHVKFETEKYSDPSKLYYEIKKDNLADVYILDMIMSCKSGIDIGNKIREMDGQSIIIYITSSGEFALDAYGVHAIRYLVKPVREDRFFEAMDYALSYTDAKKDAVYLVKTKKGLVSLPYSKIEYIENASRMLNIFLNDGESVQSIFIRKSFDEEIKEIVEDEKFLQVHKSFIVNLRYVKRIDKNNIIMESNHIIPVSKKRFADVKRVYLIFASKQYR